MQRLPRLSFLGMEGVHLITGLAIFGEVPHRAENWVKKLPFWALVEPKFVYKNAEICQKCQTFSVQALEGKL